MATLYTSLDLTAAAAGLKTYYVDGLPKEVVLKNHPLLALVEKETGLVGEDFHVPVVIENPQGVGNTFANAQTNLTTSVRRKFKCTVADHYGFAKIATKTILASRNDRGAFIRDAAAEINFTARSVGDEVATGLFRAGTGTVGKISAEATGVITLVDKTDALNFHLGMKCGAATVDGTGGTERAGTGYVIAVDRRQGKVTFAATLNGSAATPTAWAANDFIFRDGNRNATMKGLAAWLPSSVSGGESFFGLDRSQDRDRLAGVYEDLSSLSVEDALVEGATAVHAQGGTTDYAFVGTGSYAALLRELGSKVHYIEHKVGEIAFEGVKVHGGKKPFTVLADPDCPAKTAFLLQMDTWKLYSMGEVPMILDEDGVSMLRKSDADAYEVRVGAYCQLACNAPGWNGRFALGA